MKDSNSVEEMKKALKCLYLEVDSSIADDLTKRFDAVIQSQQPEIKYNGQKLIGIARERFKQLLHKKWDWRSFYNGWIEGRSDMLQEIKGIKTELPQVEESKKELYYQQSVLNPYPSDSQSACAYKKGFYESYDIFINQKGNDSDAVEFAEWVKSKYFI